MIFNFSNLYLIHVKDHYSYDLIKFSSIVMEMIFKLLRSIKLSQIEFSDGQLTKTVTVTGKTQINLMLKTHFRPKRSGAKPGNAKTR